ncbi:EVE domain-containing protein [bacterium]|nr:EVE domain-containing protein [bacterium]
MASKSVTYWLGLFNVDTWNEFKSAGMKVMGFNEKKWSIAQRLKEGDRILCYLTKVSAFVSVLEVTGEAFQSKKRIWKDGLYPVRIGVKPITEVPTTWAIQMNSLKESLSIFKGLKNRSAWSIWVRSAPRKWPAEDGRLIERKLSSRKKGLKETASEGGSKTKPAIKKKKASKAKSNETSVVRVVRRVGEIAESFDEPLGARDAVLSGNKVTGYSVNFPIWDTCRPTKVCIETCYYSKGYNTWTNALKHQLKVYNSARKDPKEFAGRIALEYDKHNLTYIRWNGGGDLFPESVESINYLGEQRRDINIWVVTRKPELAAKIEQAKNVYIHFSLDKHSLDRKKKFEQLSKLSSNYFYSYQTEAEEMPSEEKLKDVSVMFFDRYKPTGDYSWMNHEIVCPLNETDDISNTCGSCRRCFNGKAVKSRAIRKL